MSRSESPSLDELLTLLAVVDEGSRDATAKVLGVKQPVVSRRLRVFRQAPSSEAVFGRPAQGGKHADDRGRGVVKETLDAALVTHSPLQIEAIARWAWTSRAELQIDHLADLPLCVIAGRNSPLAQPLQNVLAGQIVPVELLVELPLAGLDRESGIRRQIGKSVSSRSRKAFVLV